MNNFPLTIPLFPITPISIFILALSLYFWINPFNHWINLPSLNILKRPIFELSLNHFIIISSTTLFLLLYLIHSIVFFWIKSIIIWDDSIRSRCWSGPSWPGPWWWRMMSSTMFRFVFTIPTFMSSFIFWFTSMFSTSMMFLGFFGVIRMTIMLFMLIRQVLIFILFMFHVFLF